MKKILLAVLMCASLCVMGQTERKGNTFIQTKNTAARDTIVTQYNYQTRDGKNYKIVLNKKSGACYIWKISKNGKGYRQYMSQDVKAAICSEMKVKTK